MWIKSFINATENKKKHKKMEIERERERRTYAQSVKRQYNKSPMLTTAPVQEHTQLMFTCTSTQTPKLFTLTLTQSMFYLCRFSSPLNSTTTSHSITRICFPSRDKTWKRGKDSENEWVSECEEAFKTVNSAHTHAHKQQKHANLCENPIVFCFHPGLLILLDSQMPLFLAIPREHIVQYIQHRIFEGKKNSPSVLVAAAIVVVIVFLFLFSHTHTHNIRFLFTALSSRNFMLPLYLNRENMYPWHYFPAFFSLSIFSLLVFSVQQQQQKQQKQQRQ